MRVVTFRGESSVGAIADRVYAQLSSTSREKAIAALLRENPQLTTLDKVSPGTILIVPKISGLRPTPSREQENPADEIGQILIHALKDYGDTIAARHDEFEDQVKEQQLLLKDKQLGKAIKDSRLATELVVRTTKSIAAETKAATDTRKRLEAAIEKLVSDISNSGR